MAKIQSIKNVTPIRRSRGSLSNEVIAQIEEARATVFEALSMVDVARAAVVSGKPADEHSMEDILQRA
jgi:hypothetical protein